MLTSVGVKGDDMTVCADAFSSIRWVALRVALTASAFVAAAAVPVSASAQSLERFDPDTAYPAASPATQPTAPASGGIDADLMSPQAPPALPATQPEAVPAPSSAPSPASVPDSAPVQQGEGVGAWSEGDFAPAATPVAQPAAAPVPAATTAQAGAATYGQDDLIGAAEGLFGKGAEGLAKLIEGILAKQGRPNAYIVGREAGGALVLGARYGSGTLHHKIEGERRVYWTGPSVGFDAGANASNTFVLVYNLYDSEDLFARFPAGEGQAYFVGGFHASYLRKGDTVLIPIRVGAGLRLGINAGYLRFSEKQRWAPF